MLYEFNALYRNWKLIIILNLKKNNFFIKIDYLIFNIQNIIH